MDSRSSNPLLSSQRSSQLQAVLHPLVLLTISDYITRHTLRQQTGPIVGALLGQQNGREITIEHAFECHTSAAPTVEGGFLLDAEKFSSRLEQMVQVHKERQLDFVGWYTLLPSTGPTPTIIPIHSQILRIWNESAILLGFHPEEAVNHSVGGKLPLTIYESNYEVDELRADQDGEDRKMDDGESKLKLKFREVPYSVETDETEMISMNYVASGGGSAAAAAPPKEERPTRSVESNGKGKRRLVESNVDDIKEQALDEENVPLTREEEETLASLITKANAIKMLHSRIRLLVAYLERLPSSFVNGETADDDSMDTDNTAPSLPILRQIQALVSRLDLIIPSDQEAYEKEMHQEANNVHLLGLLNQMMQGVTEARQVGKKFHIIESAKSSGRRGASDFQGSSSFNLPGAGELLI
ncbi:COP9 signalosome subunit 6 (CsnF) [Purpureocillium lilacinum]|nr:COP9 signalosome subunit 6 (CsnF) [Purpureocillium lilacinum]OAQ86718.1 COP9 signalosome subunit 6 (CsnF) [Purpureocillium lilacinum]OAQ94680.1 COP9 signalosome subunit 6 (CsnF) [Purpureocillium lilacinum]